MPRLTLKDPADALDMVFVFEDTDGSKRYAKPTEVTVRKDGSGWDLLFEGSERVRHDTNKWPKVHQYRPKHWVLQGSLAWPPTHPERFGEVTEGEKLEEYIKRMKASYEETGSLTEKDWKAVFAFQLEALIVRKEKAQRKLDTANRNRARRIELERQNLLRW